MFLVPFANLQPPPSKAVITCSDSPYRKPSVALSDGKWPTLTELRYAVKWLDRARMKVRSRAGT